MEEIEEGEGGGLGEEYERERTEKSRENYLFDMIK